ncbi:PREDICTED: uncharacterized protein At4g02000-like [Brassica oleracea var. oleracea]|uniref:uncharacterized protein At4g02000-like n=1 Tax=Brassica oleracea var. oleracea TaxID=109376 RepID=UPI0006A6AEE0|nr:PREDICTED: uncharacterized protein At4g02000-like [Brassica oleracea var. oleracea]
MPQVWNLEGRLEGRDLGPERFQFRFESENDLLTVLAKGPYHHKKWMLLLQRWEPTISPTFPSMISFWIRIHGIPLHHWTDEALYAIGKALGHVSTKDVRESRIRVALNGLLPLEMNSEIQLPYGEVMEVSLLHEENDCPRRPHGNAPLKDRKLGITQALALERIEAEKRRHDERQGYKTLDARCPGQLEGKAAPPRQSHHSSENRGHYELSRRNNSEHTERSNMSQIPYGRRILTLYRPRFLSRDSLRHASPNSRSFTSQRFPPRTRAKNYRIVLSVSPIGQL